MISYKSLRHSLERQKRKYEIEIAQLRSLLSLAEDRLKRTEQDLQGLEESRLDLEEKKRAPRLPQELVENTVSEVLAEGGQVCEHRSLIFSEVLSRLAVGHPDVPLRWLSRQVREVLASIATENGTSKAPSVQPETATKDTLVETLPRETGSK